MRIVNPTFGEAATGTAGHAASELDWFAASMCMFTNAKPNASELLEKIRTRLGQKLDRTDIGFEGKQNSAIAAEPTLLDWLAQQYSLAVLAVGD